MNGKHKVNCLCSVCKAVRGETKGIPLSKRHKSNCNCCICKAMHGESRCKGVSLSKRHKVNCPCCVCRAKRGEIKEPTHRDMVCILLKK